MRQRYKGEKFDEITNVGFDCDSFYEDFGNPNSSNYKAVEDVILNLALCHTVILEAQKSGKTIYNASSPDELALVNAAKMFGVEFVDRDHDNNITINFKGKMQKY